MAYGENVVSDRTVKKWFARFRPKDVYVEEISEAPRKVLHEEIQSFLDEYVAYIQKTPWWTSRSNSRPNISKIERRKMSCSWAKQREQNSKSWYLLKLVQPLWKVYYLYDSPRQEKAWSDPVRPFTAHAKQRIFMPRKCSVCLVGLARNICYDLLKPGETFTSERYQDRLINLSAVLEETRPQKREGNREVIYPQDISRAAIHKSWRWPKRLHDYFASEPGNL